MVKIIPNRKAQSSLECTIALVAAVALLLGITQVFVWLNKMMVERHQAYDATRTSSTAAYDFYEPESFNIFGE